MGYKESFECRRTWFKSHGDGTYTAYMVEYQPRCEVQPWYAGGGTFSLGQFDDADVEWCISRRFPVEDRREIGEDMLARALFMDHWEIFNLESFDTEEEAAEWLRKEMRK